MLCKPCPSQLDQVQSLPLELRTEFLTPGLAVTVVVDIAGTGVVVDLSVAAAAVVDSVAAAVEVSQQVAAAVVAVAVVGSVVVVVGAAVDLLCLP